MESAAGSAAGGASVDSASMAADQRVTHDAAQAAAGRRMHEVNKQTDASAAVTVDLANQAAGHDPSNAVVEHVAGIAALRVHFSGHIVVHSTTRARAR